MTESITQKMTISNLKCKSSNILSSKYEILSSISFFEKLNAISKDPENEIPS